MDNIQNNQPLPTTPTQPLQQPVGQQMKNGNKTTYLIIFLILLALITAMLLFLTTNDQKTTQIQSSTTPTQVLSPSPSTTDSPEEQEVNKINIEDTSPTDFPQVEKEIQSL